VLTGGIAIVPAFIGLFAIPQVFSLAEKLDVHIERPVYKPEKSVLLGFFNTPSACGREVHYPVIV